MILYAALLACVAAIGLLIVAPAWGVLAAFLAKPLIDATWDQPVVLGLKLTEIISGSVPLIILLRMPFARDEQAFRNMPLRAIWLAWSAWIAIASVAIMYNEGLLIGTNVLFRHLNGLVGFYMVQAFFARDEARTKQFVWCLLLAGVFPVGTGLYEALTGAHWRITHGEAGVVRGVGLYHDAITIRYYALQTIMGLLLFSVLYVRRNVLVNAAAVVYGMAAAFVLQRAYSKSGALTLGAWAILWPTLLRKFQMLTAVALAVIAAAAWYSEQIIEGFGFIFHKEIAALHGDMGVERTFAGRWYTWHELIDQWQGFSTMAQLFGSGHMAVGAHNDYIQVLFHGGVIGLGIYIALLLAILARIVRNLLVRIDVFAVAPLLAMIMWLVDTIGLVPSAYSGYQWFVWGVIGLCLRKRQDEALAPQGDANVVAVDTSAAEKPFSPLLPRPASSLLLNRR